MNIRQLNVHLFEDTATGWVLDTGFRYEVHFKRQNNDVRIPVEDGRDSNGSLSTIVFLQKAEPRVDLAQIEYFKMFLQDMNRENLDNFLIRV